MAGEQDGILNTEHDLCSYNKTINTHVITPVCNTRIVPQPACAGVCREWQMLHNQRLEIIQSAPGFCDSWRISNYILWTSFLLLFITMWFPLFCVNLISVWWSSVPLTITRVCCCGYFWTFWAHIFWAGNDDYQYLLPTVLASQCPGMFHCWDMGQFLGVNK